MVHGPGVQALHAAHVHVGERHGLHYGGGALLLRGASAVPRQGVRRSQKKGGVSTAASECLLWIKAGLVSNDAGLSLQWDAGGVVS